MPSLPFIKFYPKDWLTDEVAECSLAAQGLWLRMMILMHLSDRYGYLSHNGVPIPQATLARRCNCGLTQYASLLEELDSHGVPSRTAEGIIYSRRMVRDEQKRRKSVQYGKLGGNPLVLEHQSEVNPSLNATLISDDLASEGVGEGSGKPKGTAALCALVPEPLRTDAFVKAWQEFIQHRRQIRKPMTPLAATKLVNKLAKFPAVAVTAIEEAIANGWQGVFPENIPTRAPAPNGGYRNGKPTVADRDREVAERARAELEAELRMHQ